jgi:tRNA C32,U32 (ribose-2'-O)-methylase TrmJ
MGYKTSGEAVAAYNVYTQEQQAADTAANNARQASVDTTAKNYNGLSSYGQQLWNQFGYSYMTTTNKMAVLQSALKNGKINENEYTLLKSRVGV